MAANKREKQVRKIFPNLYRYREDKKKRTALITIEGRDLVFDNLQQLSELLGTTNIDISNTTLGYCDGFHGDGSYCYCTNESEIDLYCTEVKFND